MADRSPRVLAFVMAHRAETSWGSLTHHRCKPAVPFDGQHCLIDFVLSNLVNSGIHSIYVLAEPKSTALIDHLRSAWSFPHAHQDRFVTLMPPQNPGATNGSMAQVLHQNARLIHEFQPDVVAVFGGDHVYRMDVRQMVAFHRQTRAHVSIATCPVKLAHCHQFGVIEFNSENRVTDFQENPDHADPMPGSQTHVCGSMGNYLFDPDVLLGTLNRFSESPAVDFGRDILPSMVRSHRLMAYDFHQNTIPGMADYEESGYWRNISGIDPYFDAQFDTLGTTPRFRLNNQKWPLQVAAGADPSESAQIENATVTRSVIGSGCFVDGAILDHALLRRSVTVEKGASLAHCIVMDRTVIGAGAHVRRAIIDVGNAVPAGEKIGYDREKDQARFQISARGVVVVPAGYFKGI